MKVADTREGGVGGDGGASAPGDRGRNQGSLGLTRHGRRLGKQGGVPGFLLLPAGHELG